ncbi:MULTISPECIES: I78 family peptidase inhibitor [Streptomyces]|uniref:I78 family peptidase inhibitor n=1 Tax=Streptomyces sudanensis TaxID=436397 RepID=A0ABY4TGG9_9ACTN|nr:MULTISPECIES: I78 family peptidase inhibitor [Streptomyces]MCP9988600.1 I78 family peptidase inhibitor [Streptomyces sudanensis]MCQ0000023.1 I78 family peptidase inhibitor [Streptomyces sudanensis]URN17872.1 I78 family peptidase inhibitor [Streptomyces sudanensis]
MASTPTTPPERPDEPDTYVGLDEQEAASLARSRGWTTVRTLPPGVMITLEYLEGRINFEVRDHTVTRCWTG